MTRRAQKLTIICTAIFFVFIVVFLFLFDFTNNLEVVFFDVGQGDSILIKSPYGQNILIDGGPDNKVLEKLGNNLSWYDKEIDLLIISHPHDDHIIGFIEIVKRYKVNKIIYTGVKHSSPGYLKLLKEIEKKEIPLVVIDQIQNIFLGDNCDLNILYPNESFLDKKVKNLNNNSIVSKLDCIGHKFLFTGDAEKEQEEEILNSGVDIKADVSKLGHHGSNTSNTYDFLKTVNPTFAVIQVGADNDFGHPKKSVLDFLDAENIKYFRNDLDGTIKFIDMKGELKIEY